MRISDWSSDVCSSDLLTREMIGHMVNNLISESSDLIERSGVQSPEDVREAGRALIAFSPAMLRAEHQMKAFLRAHMYRHPAVLELTNAAQSVVGTLAEAYLAAPERMPEEWRSEEHTSELQSLMRISYAVFCLKKKNIKHTIKKHTSNEQ